ncbi:MAG: GTP cyclohydrolase FolE2 [Bdellovibrionales bacterium]|nr:GTP cyclohydrolase FolE2 [Bdellovibrionales bacterium]
MDVSKEPSTHPFPLEQVGLKDIEIPLKIQWEGEVQSVLAVIEAVVSLDDPHQRGIHMSRIYHTLHEFSENEVLSPKTMRTLLKKIVDVQEDHCLSGHLKIQWKSIVRQKSLVSSRTGFRVYPCFYEMNTQGDFISGVELLYSSTCPCSAALARELVKDQFKKDAPNADQILNWLGKEQSIAGTAHAQRSQANIQIKTKQDENYLSSVITDVEEVLATSVQVAVKREDEKQFAHLNSQNLMYSEDAIRRIKHYLEKQEWITAYHVEIGHFESLHPFNTVARTMKNWK